MAYELNVGLNATGDGGSAVVTYGTAASGGLLLQVEQQGRVTQITGTVIAASPPLDGSIDRVIEQSEELIARVSGRLDEAVDDAGERVSDLAFRTDRSVRKELDLDGFASDIVGTTTTVTAAVDDAFRQLDLEILVTDTSVVVYGSSQAAVG